MVNVLPVLWSGQLEIIRLKWPTLSKRRHRSRKSLTPTSMASPPNRSFLYLLLLLLTFRLLAMSESKSTDPIPATWPLQFHSILFINTNGSLQKTDLWYDWPNGRNFNIIQKQLGELLYDLEWNNGTSYYYTLDANKKCKVMSFSVGILRPDFLKDAVYVGQQYRDNFLCNVWKKVDFITYYEDAASKRPVGWDFFTGMSTHVITFEVGKVLEDPGWQAPVYCFTSEAKNKPLLEPMGSESLHDPVAHGILMKGFKDVPKPYQ